MRGEGMEEEGRGKGNGRGIRTPLRIGLVTGLHSNLALIMCDVYIGCSHITLKHTQGQIKH